MFQALLSLHPQVRRRNQLVAVVPRCRQAILRAALRKVRHQRQHLQQASEVVMEAAEQVREAALAATLQMAVQGLLELEIP